MEQQRSSTVHCTTLVQVSLPIFLSRSALISSLLFTLLIGCHVVLYSLHLLITIINLKTWPPKDISKASDQFWLKLSLCWRDPAAPGVANKHLSGGWSFSSQQQSWCAFLKFDSWCLFTGKVVFEWCKEMPDNGDAPGPAQKLLSSTSAHVGHVCVVDREAKDPVCRF